MGKLLKAYSDLDLDLTMPIMLPGELLFELSCKHTHTHKHTRRLTSPDVANFCYCIEIFPDMTYLFSLIIFYLVQHCQRKPQQTHWSLCHNRHTTKPQQHIGLYATSETQLSDNKHMFVCHIRNTSKSQQTHVCMPHQKHN